MKILAYVAAAVSVVFMAASVAVGDPRWATFFGVAAILNIVAAELNE